MSSSQIQHFPHGALRAWFEEHARSLPWRTDRTPYRVWISEVMLQQTQACVVEPYFLRWMEAFPDISTLAQAPLSQVIKMWEGLGYYARARHLHAAACLLCQHHEGEIPQDKTALARLPGMGAYTQGAIRSFAFQQKAAAVDANVLRVMMRYMGCEQEIGTGRVRDQVAAWTEAVLPEQEPWVIMEALIELGALVCGKKPQCSLCPLRAQCSAWQQGLQMQLPRKPAARVPIYLEREVAVIEYDGHYLLKQCPKGEIMAGLYEFPYVSREPDTEVSAVFQHLIGIPLRWRESLPRVVHTFTHHRVRLFPHLFEALAPPLPGQLWVERATLENLPFSSGHRRIKHLLQRDPVSAVPCGLRSIV